MQNRSWAYKTAALKEFPLSCGSSDSASDRAQQHTLITAFYFYLATL